MLKGEYHDDMMVNINLVAITSSCSLFLILTIKQIVNNSTINRLYRPKHREFNIYKQHCGYPLKPMVEVQALVEVFLYD